MRKQNWRYVCRAGRAISLGLLCCTAAAAAADSQGQLDLAPTDHGLLRLVERHSLGIGHREFRLHGVAPYHYRYQYRVYPYPHTEPGLEFGPINPAGRLIVTTQPTDATVLVDGYPLSRTEGNTHEVGLLVGTHRLEVHAPGYATHRQDVDVRTGNQHHLEITLQPE